MADSSTIEKVTAIGGLLLQAAIIGLLIWLVYKAYQCGTDNSQCPAFIYSIIHSGVKYDKYKGMSPLIEDTEITDKTVTSANTCAKWCTKKYGCNGFVWKESSKKCFTVPGDTKSLLMFVSDRDTYIAQEADHPVAGFIMDIGKDFTSNVSYRLGSMMSNVSTLSCVSNCQATSNCAGFTGFLRTNQENLDCQLVSNVSNVVTTTGALGFTWRLLPASSYAEATF